ncbi:hypothetical protein [Halalkalicoccus subterraneus]|uniref:hypothetical protein n=1 Tax=Halalkalicoccus subterraneus TaxID=2675002 RepID=UPI000EFBD169|nr:hypothetical protein [Halalkalicoccus subterraneus]
MSDDRGYVYEPGVETTTDPADREFDWQGWTLVGVVVLTFLVAPAIILFQPPDMLPFFVAYLVLPLVPAVVLGLVAVLVTARP